MRYAWRLDNLASVGSGIEGWLGQRDRAPPPQLEDEDEEVVVEEVDAVVLAVNAELCDCSCDRVDSTEAHCCTMSFSSWE